MAERRCSTTRTGRAVISDRRASWVVLLEAAPKIGASLVDIATARAVLRAMGDEDGVGLYAPDRVAVQVRVHGRDVAVALSVALVRWRIAAGMAALTGWVLVRAEVLTPDEFERDCERI